MNTVSIKTDVQGACVPRLISWGLSSFRSFSSPKGELLLCGGRQTNAAPSLRHHVCLAQEHHTRHLAVVLWWELSSGTTRNWDEFFSSCAHTKRTLVVVSQTVAVLFGWMGSTHQHLAKYAGIFQERSISTIQHTCPITIGCARVPSGAWMHRWHADDVSVAAWPEDKRRSVQPSFLICLRISWMKEAIKGVRRLM